MIEDAKRIYDMDDELEICAKEIKNAADRPNTNMKNCAEGIAILSDTGKFLYTTTAVQSMLGYTEKEIQKISVLDLLGIADSNLFVEILKSAVANPGTEAKFRPITIKHQNGSWLILEGNITHVINNPSITGNVVTFRDLTNQNLESDKIDQLNLSELSKVLEFSLDVICTVNINKEFVNVSKASEKITGYSPE